MEASSRQPRVESFHRLLEQRVDEWLSSEEARRFPCAELYRHLPALFLFLAELALDPQIPERERAAVLSALKYIVAPFDLIPEGVVGTSGFRDDLVLAALVVDRLAARVDHAALLAHWREVGDPFEVARTILDAGDAMVGPEICERLRGWLPA